MRRASPWLVVAIALLALAGCGGPGRVQYDGGRCLKDGRPLTADEVEAEQATVATRIASRQPWFAVITIGVVVLAVAGNAEKLLLLVRSRHTKVDRPVIERLRDVMLARQRERPALVGMMLGGTLSLVMLAGAAYVYLDIDKRTSERALGMLQFCHLALRTQQEEGALNEQRRNLQAIQATAGDIRTLVGKLPPDQQRKAQQIVEQLNGALDRQGKAVSEYVARTDEAQKDLNAHTMAMEKGLASVEGEIAELRALPGDLKDLEGAAQHIDATTKSLDERLADLRARTAAIDGKLDALVARPACAQPAAESVASKPAPKPAASAAPAASSHPAEVASARADVDAGSTH